MSETRWPDLYVCYQLYDETNLELSDTVIAYPKAVKSIEDIETIRNIIGERVGCGQNFVSIINWRRMESDT